MKRIILAVVAVLTVATGAIAGVKGVSVSSTSPFEGMNSQQVQKQLGKADAVLSCNSATENKEAGCPDGGSILFYKTGKFTNQIVFNKSGYVVSSEPRYWEVK